VLNGSFLLADGVLIAGQAALVALPGRGVPKAIGRLRAGGWALLAPFSIVAAVIAGSLGPGVATALSRLALLAVPLLAAAALGWAARGARPAYALLVPPLLAFAWSGAGSVPGDAAAAALSALSCVTLGRLLAGAVPGAWLKAGLLAWAVYDAITVFGSRLSPDAIVDAAVPAPGLPQLQVLDLHAASIGYADVFVAAVLGGVLSAQGTRAGPVAVLALGFSIAFDFLFLAFDTLPATVPIALALLVSEAARRRGGAGRRPVDRSSPCASRRTAPGGRDLSASRPTTGAVRAASIPVMSLTRIRLLCAASLGLLAATLVITGCGAPPDHDGPSGTTVVRDGVAYPVQTSRALNPLHPDDESLLRGVRGGTRLDGPDTTPVVVFLQASDEASGTRRAIPAPQVVDAFGRVFRPLDPLGNDLDYHGGRLSAGQQIPDPRSDAAESPADGAALIYRVPADVLLTDRPFTLRFGAGDAAASVQLDL
jgi:hypothetical protein